MWAPSCGCKLQDPSSQNEEKHWLSQPIQGSTLTSTPSDSIANIAKVEPAIADVPCSDILGLVIYDLPGRDCAAKASNGELKVGELSRYKTEYIDPIVKILKAHSNTAFALVIEPDSLPNLVTNSDLTTCQQSAQGYRDGVAYAIKQLNLPNVVMYIDAGHGGWLGWNDNLSPGAKELANAYKAGGSPKQFRGFATNVAGWNAWDQSPGEFSSAPDAQYNKCQNEKIYVEYVAFKPKLPPPLMNIETWKVAEDEITTQPRKDSNAAFANQEKLPAPSRLS